ncbi:MAG: AAA family ATPase [Nitrospirae bacterium]|nr:MAG: AAA family ATPase [Nitrospirota bacterium]
MPTAAAYITPFKPMTIKRLLLQLGIDQATVSRSLDVSRALVSLVINRGYIPPSMRDIRERIEQLLVIRPDVDEWLKKNQTNITAIWQIEGEDLRDRKPSGANRRGRETNKMPAIVICNPNTDASKIKEEDYMLSQEAKKHFKMFRHPFLNDMEKDGDTYMGEDHRYILEVMDFAANHGGMVAVIGEVGSGKTSMRRELEKRIRRSGDIRIVYPRIIDKSRATASSLCDAIVYDLTDGKGTPKSRLEAKSRQVEQHLKDHCRSGMKVAMIIEEAQDLIANSHTIKMLKRFNEIEFEGKKTIGIILIGQSELSSVFDETVNYHMREVIRRFEVAIIRGLNGDLKTYLDHKFKRVGVDLKTIITDEGIKALSDRLTTKEGRRKVSIAYPLTVNRWMVRAMNEAVELGERIVTPEIINSLQGLEAL